MKYIYRIDLVYNSNYTDLPDFIKEWEHPIVKYSNNTRLLGYKLYSSKAKAFQVAENTLKNEPKYIVTHDNGLDLLAFIESEKTSYLMGEVYTYMIKKIEVI